MSDEFDGKALATLRKVGSRFEITYPEYDLIIRGPHVEWVLEAAAEIISRSERVKIEGAIEEMEMLTEFGEEGLEMEVESKKFEHQSRFEIIPQCLVSMGANDYRWVQREGRSGPDHTYVQRLYDTSLTRQPGSWLEDPTRKIA
jgi:hypothetical protein